MSRTTCSRCGNDYDTERETPRETMNSARCPKCGQENEPRPARADGGTVAVPSNRDVPAGVTNVLESIEADGRELHVHFHFHGE